MAEVKRRHRRPLNPDSLFVPRAWAPDVTGLSLQFIDEAIHENLLPAFRVTSKPGAKRYRLLIERKALIAFATAQKHDPTTRFRSDGYISPFRKKFVEDQIQER